MESHAPIYDAIPRDLHEMPPVAAFTVTTEQGRYLVSLQLDVRHGSRYTVYDPQNHPVDAGVVSPDLSVRDELYLTLKGLGIEQAPVAQSTMFLQPHRLFVDMDGTLAEFRSNASFEDLHAPGYFASLQPQEQVVQAVRQLVQDPNLEVFVLSSALDTPTAQPEKCAWLDRYLPEIDALHRLFPRNGTDKALVVPGGIRKTDLLLDDFSRNLHAWAAAGGIGIKLINHLNDHFQTWSLSDDRRKCAMVDFRQSGDAMARTITAYVNLRSQLLNLSQTELQAVYRYVGLHGILNAMSQYSEVLLTARSAQFCAIIDDLFRCTGYYPAKLVTYPDLMGHGKKQCLCYRAFESAGAYSRDVSAETREELRQALLKLPVREPEQLSLFQKLQDANARADIHKTRSEPSPKRHLDRF